MDRSSLWSIREFWFHEVDMSAKITVVSGDKCFEIDLSPIVNSSDSLYIRKKYVEYIEAACDDDDIECADYATQDLQNWIIQPFLPIFRQIETPATSSYLTFHDYLYPETNHYVVHAENDELVPYADYRPSRGWIPYGVDLDESISAQWPLFSPRQIQICFTGPPGLAIADFPRKVVVSGKTLSMKPIHHGQKRTVLREIETYRKIRKLLQETGGHLQTPRLHGLVQEENGSQIVALLLTWIDCRRATNFECIANPRNDAPLSLRLKWMGQIESTLEVLHQAGIVWGDVKAANVLIDDVNQDAWIIDFGGGYTHRMGGSGQSQHYRGRPPGIVEDQTIPKGRVTIDWQRQIFAKRLSRLRMGSVLSLSLPDLVLSIAK
jgi:serine/threonine protein kinase